MVCQNTGRRRAHAHERCEGKRAVGARSVRASLLLVRVVLESTESNNGLFTLLRKCASRRLKRERHLRDKRFLPAGKRKYPQLKSVLLVVFSNDLCR